MSVLGHIPFLKTVPATVKAARMAKCKGCPHFLQETGTCGPPLNKLNPWGKEVIYNGFPVKLCGCIMNEKTELPNAHCPTNQWREYRA